MCFYHFCYLVIIIIIIISSGFAMAPGSCITVFLGGEWEIPIPQFLCFRMYRLANVTGDGRTDRQTEK